MYRFLLDHLFAVGSIRIIDACLLLQHLREDLHSHTLVQRKCAS